MIRFLILQTLCAANTAKADAKQVPAFVMSDPEYKRRHDDRQTIVFDKMTGNVPLEYVLWKFAEVGDHRDIAMNYLKFKTT